MTDAVLVIGPGAVHGPHPVSQELAGTALDAVDDDHVFVDDDAVDVDLLWRAVIAAAAGEPAGPLVLVCPGWWSAARVGRVQRATADAETVVGRRAEILRTDADCVIEIAPEFVLIHAAGLATAAIPRLDEQAAIPRLDEQAAIPRLDEQAGVGDAVLDAVTGWDGIRTAGTVLVDAPIGVAGAADLAATIAGRLRAWGSSVRIVDDHFVLRSAADARRPATEPGVLSSRWRTPAAAVLVGAVLSVGVLFGAVRDSGGGAPAATLLVEGRVAVRVPAGWAVQRITGGPGSPRLQVTSPDFRGAAVLITQSPAGPGSVDTAAVLQRALALAPPGVFTDFLAAEHRGGRTVVGYTEVRRNRVIDWSVFVDGEVRIAVGCQHPAEPAGAIGAVCEAAIRSAHAVA